MSLLVSLAAILLVLVLLVALFRHVPITPAFGSEPANVVLARRAAQLRTRPLAGNDPSPDARRFLDSFVTEPPALRVVPVLQNGQLARPIVTDDWRR